MVVVVREFANHGIAFACSAFQALAVEDVDVTALIFDQTDALQRARRHGDGGAARTEHLREELLRDEKHVILDAVLQHEQPAGEPLLDFVQAIAGYELAEDERLGLHAMLNALAQRRQILELRFEIGFVFGGCKVKSRPLPIVHSAGGEIGKAAGFWVSRETM